MEKSKREKREVPFRTTLLFRILPAALALALFLAGVRMRDRYESERADREARLETLAAERDAARSELDGLDPAAPAYALRWETLTGELLAEADTRADALTAELRETEDAVLAAREELTRWTADEEYVYYRTVYNAWEEGRAYVEELLSEG